MSAFAAPIPARRRWTQHPLWHAFIGVLATVLPIAIGLALAEALAPKAWRVVWPQLLAMGLSVMGYCLYVRRVEKRAVGELNLTGAASEVIAGVALGAVLAGATLGLLALSGALHIDSVGAWTTALRPLGEMALVAVFEELLFRGILFRKTEGAWGSRAALAVTAAVFVLAHLPGEGFSAMAAVITAIAALAFAGAYMLTRRLWLPIGMHFAWNTCFESIVSLPVSGHATHGWISARLQGPLWLSGGTYGVEASVVTLGVWAIAAAVLLSKARWRK